MKSIKVDNRNRIYNDLPDDKRKWKYNMNALSEVNPYINKFVAVYVNEFLKDEFKEFKEMVNSDVVFYQEAYIHLRKNGTSITMINTKNLMLK